MLVLSGTLTVDLQQKTPCYNNTIGVAHHLFFSNVLCFHMQTILTMVFLLFVRLNDLTSSHLYLCLSTIFTNFINSINKIVFANFLVPTQPARTATRIHFGALVEVCAFPAGTMCLLVRFCHQHSLLQQSLVCRAPSLIKPIEAVEIVLHCRSRYLSLRYSTSSCSSTLSFARSLISCYWVKRIIGGLV